MKDHEYRYDKIIVGNSLEALLLGYGEGCPVITLNPREPLFFENYDPSIDLSFLGLDNTARTLTKKNQQITVGIEKYKVYRRVSFLMSLAGLLPFAGKGKTIREIGERKVRIVLDRARAASFTYEKSVIIGQNLLQPEIPPNRYMVLDWMDVRSGMIHPYDRIETAADFVNHIYFYPSERIDGAHDKKDLVSVSYLTREQMNSYEYSDTYARFKILESMRSLGIRGARNGRDTKNPERYKYYAVKIETNRREAIPTESEISILPRPTSHRYLKHLTEKM